MGRHYDGIDLFSFQCFLYLSIVPFEQNMRDFLIAKLLAQGLIVDQGNVASGGESLQDSANNWIRCISNDERFFFPPQ